eukprot:764138-Hanusia_phi.AAC.7
MFNVVLLMPLWETKQVVRIRPTLRLWLLTQASPGRPAHSDSRNSDPEPKYVPGMAGEGKTGGGVRSGRYSRSGRGSKGWVQGRKWRRLRLDKVEADGNLKSKVWQEQLCCSCQEELLRKQRRKQVILLCKEASSR